MAGGFFSVPGGRGGMSHVIAFLAGFIAGPFAWGYVRKRWLTFD